ncbi:MAG: GTP-binding protein, partial [Rhodospirillales bacterium]
MQLKTFTAATTAEAMRMVREELGDDAIIVSTQRPAAGKGVHVVATLEAAPRKPLDHAPRRPAAGDATGTVHDFPGL